MVREGQKWPKCTSTSPVLIINDKKRTFGGVKILTYFFTRNVPFRPSFGPLSTLMAPFGAKTFSHFSQKVGLTCPREPSGTIKRNFCSATFEDLKSPQKSGHFKICSSLALGTRASKMMIPGVKYNVSTSNSGVGWALS